MFNSAAAMQLARNDPECSTCRLKRIHVLQTHWTNGTAFYGLHPGQAEMPNWTRLPDASRRIQAGMKRAPAWARAPNTTDCES